MYVPINEAWEDLTASQIMDLAFWMESPCGGFLAEVDYTVVLRDHACWGGGLRGDKVGVFIEGFHGERFVLWTIV